MSETRARRLVCRAPSPSGPQLQQQQQQQQQQQDDDDELEHIPVDSYVSVTTACTVPSSHTANHNPNTHVNIARKSPCVFRASWRTASSTSFSPSRWKLASATITWLVLRSCRRASDLVSSCSCPAHPSIHIHSEPLATLLFRIRDAIHSLTPIHIAYRAAKGLTQDTHSRATAYQLCLEPVKCNWNRPFRVSHWHVVVRRSTGIAANMPRPRGSLQLLPLLPDPARFNPTNPSAQCLVS
jgi:hypothetical protein